MTSTSNPPQGTFLPGTKVQVGSHKVYIEKYLSEGGFAHVYVVRIPRDNNKHELAVLKRVAVPDKDHLASMRTEVETMKKLRGHKHIVTYIDSHASQLKGGGYEVFLLMEYCNGGGLIDFMNTRLQHRLTEPEILKIFGDCAEGVATMHYLKPPLLHRDLKVENVLISKAVSGTPFYKLCDFGSTAPPRPAATTVEEGRLIEDDVQKHTTMQYRSPEMIDVWRKKPIDEKSDIWALGVLLYKLCYYTTPFEDVGQMAILNASFKYPSYPSFSERLKRLIGAMLKEDPAQRPNIYQVVKEVCSMRGTEVPIKDIYANRTQSEARKNQSLPSNEAVSSAPVGLQKTAPKVEVQAIPDITPMRRGRPGAPTAQIAGKPAPSPARGDPFAALDSKNYDIRAGAVDELSKRFPSLDEFAIAHDGGGKFAFPTSPPPGSQTTKGAPNNGISERVTAALADELFASKSPPPSAMPKQQEFPKAPARKPSPSKPVASATIKEVRQPDIKQPLPVRAGPAGTVYKSTLTGSSPPPPTMPPRKLPQVNNRPIWRVPDSAEHDRSSSQPRASETAQAAASSLHPSLPPEKRPALLEIHRSKSQTATQAAAAHASSLRPSLEGGRPAMRDLDVSGVNRTKSLNSRTRPTSMYVSSNMDYLRDQEQSRKRPSMEIRRHSRHPSQTRDPAAEEEAIVDDMDYLRKTEENDVDRKKSMKEALRMHGHHHRKRSSLDAVRSGAKNMLTGRFGDAFKKFEHHDPQENEYIKTGLMTPEARDHDEEPQLLSPITGSEATPSRHSDMDDETEDLPPDVRREMERRRLSQEEKRVAEAAAAYRARVAAQGTGTAAAPTRASTIQKRVQSLLDEGRQSPVPRKTAEGYGRYTETSESESKPQPQSQPNVPLPSGNRPLVARKPMVDATSSNNPYPKVRQQQQPQVPQPSTVPMSAPSAPVVSDTAPLERVPSRPGPSAPPKPKALRTGGPVQWPPPDQPANTTKPISAKPTGGLAALLAKDLEGVPDYPPRGSSMNQSVPATIATHNHIADDDLDSFSKRYPSLSGIEMVETELDGRQR